MKYKIVFDTNAVWQDFSVGKLFNESIINVKEFLDKYEVKDAVLCLPDMVIEERVQQAEEKTQLNLAEVNKTLKDLKTIGYKMREIKAKKDHRSIFRKSVNKFLLKHSIELIKIPKLNAEKIVDRSIKKIKPFNDKRSGFKDTVIMFSLIEDAKKQGDQTSYILVTNNTKDFTEEVQTEFKKLTNKDLYLVDDIESLKALLDTLVPLRLKLQDLHKQIEEGVRRLTGTITSELNKTIKKSDNLWSGVFPSFPKYAPISAYSAFSPTNEDKTEIIGYDFQDLKVENISDLGDKDFKVEGELIVELRKTDKASNGIRLYMPLVAGMEQTKIFNFSLIYNLDQKTISGVGFTETHAYY